MMIFLGYLALVLQIAAFIYLFILAYVFVRQLLRVIWAYIKPIKRDEL